MALRTRPGPWGGHGRARQGSTSAPSSLPSGRPSFVYALQRLAPLAVVKCPLPTSGFCVPFSQPEIPLSLCPPPSPPLGHLSHPSGSQFRFYLLQELFPPLPFCPVPPLCASQSPGARAPPPTRPPRGINTEDQMVGLHPPLDYTPHKGRVSLA